MEGYGEDLVSILYLSLVMGVFFFQGISSLVILDLCGNPLACSTKHYRLFVIYHVTSLKALDGLAVVGSFQCLSVFSFWVTDFLFCSVKWIDAYFFSPRNLQKVVLQRTLLEAGTCVKSISRCVSYTCYHILGTSSL